MDITMYPDADAALIDIRDTKYKGTREIDLSTYLNLDTDGNAKSIQFLWVSDGVKRQQIPGLTDQENRQVFALLHGSGIEVTPSACTPGQ